MSKPQNQQNNISTLVADEHDTFVQILQELLQASADGHSSVQDFVARWFEKCGADVQRITYRPKDVTVDFELGLPTEINTDFEYVVGKYGEVGEALLFFGHSDSEPVNPSGWSRPLFDGVVDNGRLYGWGIGDDLVGIALMLALAHAQNKYDVLGSRQVMLVSTPSKKRAQGIIHAMNQGFVGNASVYLHPAESGAGLTEIKAIASGMLRFKLRITGRQPDTTEPGHTVFAHKAVDPVLKTMKVIEALNNLAQKRSERVYYEPVHTAIGQSTNLHISYLDAGHPERLGKIPTYVMLGGSITFPPTEPMTEVKAEFEEALHQVCIADDWLVDNPPNLEWVIGINGAATSLESPLYQSTSSAITTVTGTEPFVNPLHAASDIRNPMLHKGIPTVGIGPLVGDLTVSGGVDEWVDIQSYIQAVEVVCRIASEWHHTT